MKVQYVVLGGVSTGVFFKLEGKLRALREIVGFLKLTLISRGVPFEVSQASYKIIHRKYHVPLIFSKAPLFWRFEVWVDRAMLSFSFYREVRGMNRGDIIVMRYPGADFFLNMAFWLLGKRIFVFEHNTKELNELKLRTQDSYWFRYLYLMEKWYGSSLRNKASRLVAVSSDFLEYQRQTYGCDVRGQVISNGYSVISTGERVLRNRTGVHFLMLIGSYAEWHGLEIFAKALRQTDADQCCLHVVGSVPEEIIAKIGKDRLNIVFHGRQGIETRLRIAEECHIGVGALGLAKLGVQTGSSLKVRECLAWGMPVIISVDDEDLHDEAFRKKYAMKVSVENDSFDLHRVIDFFGTKIYEQEHIDNVRKYAKRHIDYSAKAAQYLDLFRDLMQGR